MNVAPEDRASGVGTGARLIAARSGAAFRAQFFLMPNPGLKPRAESLSPFGTATTTNLMLIPNELPVFMTDGCCVYSGLTLFNGIKKESAC
jgi:hypothetical protein